MTTPPAYPGPDPMNAPAPPEMAHPRPAVQRPKSMDLAVQLMWAGAALAVLGGLLTLLFVDVDELLATANPDGALTDDTARTVFWAALIGGLTLGAGLWVWMAIMNGKGKKWARTLATVFFVISVLSILASLTRPTAAITWVMNILSFLVGLGAIILMYRPESTEYYEQMSGPRY